MKLSVFLAVFFAFGTQVPAQMTPDEIAQRMAEMNKHPSTRPAVANVPASRPSVQPTLQLKAGAPKDVADFFEAFPALRDERIGLVEGGLQNAKKTMAEYRKMTDADEKVRGIRDTKELIAKLNASIDGLKNGTVIFAAPLGVQPLKVGDFFSVNCKAVVFQVIDENDFILQYIDERLPRSVDGYGMPNAIMWLSGVSTTGFIDKADFDVKPDQVFRVVGTKTYNTVGEGQKTIFSATDVDYKPYIVAAPKK